MPINCIEEDILSPSRASPQSENFNRNRHLWEQLNTESATFTKPGQQDDVMKHRTQSIVLDKRQLSMDMREIKLIPF